MGVVHHGALVDQTLQARIVIRAKALQVLIPELIDDDGDHKFGTGGRLGKQAVTR
jgi:hypothetical protein